MLYFMADHVKIEAMDSNTSIITIQCPSAIATDILTLIDYLAHASRWLKIRISASRSSLNKGGVYVA